MGGRLSFGPQKRRGDVVAFVVVRVASMEVEGRHHRGEAPPGGKGVPCRIASRRRGYERRPMRNQRRPEDSDQRT